MCIRRIICLKWAVQRGAIPIPFSASADHIKDNLLSAIHDPLTDEEMALLDKADKNCPPDKGPGVPVAGRDRLARAVGRRGVSRESGPARSADERASDSAGVRALSAL